MRACLFTLAALVLWSGAHAAGTIENRQFHSNALQEDRWMQVYLPEGYDPYGTTHYPSIYFLHGANGNHLGYPELINWLDNMIGTEAIDPVIVVKPDGSGCTWPPYWEGCGWVDSDLQGLYETYLIEDVVAFAEDAYRIIRSPAKRAIMGHSMGAFGSMHGALKHPDLFCAVVALSGYTHFGEMENQHVPLIIDEQDGEPPWYYTPDGGLFTGAWFMLAGGFSPNPSNPPYFVDFPLDSAGDPIEEVWSRWLEHDPATIALDLSPEDAPAIYFDCGTLDGFYLHPINEAFDAHLTALGIPHEFQSYVGGHWAASRLEIGLEFINSAFGGVASVEEAWDESDLEVITRFMVENPSQGKLEILFDTATPAGVLLEVFDVQGRLIDTLLAREVSIGSHSVDWNGQAVTAGVYFIRLQADGDRETRTVVVR